MVEYDIPLLKPSSDAPKISEYSAHFIILRRQFEWFPYFFFCFGVHFALFSAKQYRYIIRERQSVTSNKTKEVILINQLLGVA
jgi:hypothetical protein